MSVHLIGQKVNDCPWSFPADRVKVPVSKLDSYSLQVQTYYLMISNKEMIIFSNDFLEYSIPGTPSPLGGCNFTYMSVSKKRGEFNSPRHPARYPSNLTCTYNFLLAGPHENVRLYFDQFKVRANDTNVFYWSYCQEDWVEIYNVFYGGREILLGRYCGDSFPGPVESDPGTIGLKV